MLDREVEASLGAVTKMNQQTTSRSTTVRDRLLQTSSEEIGILMI